MKKNDFKYSTGSCSPVYSIILADTSNSLMDYSAAQRLTHKYKEFNELRFPEIDVSVFTYTVPKWQSFNEQTKWLRGLTYVGTDVYPMLPKFFNLDETPETKLSVVKDLDIESITIKRDGSLLMPIMLNRRTDGKVQFKTMKSYNNPHSQAAMRFYQEMSNYREFIDRYLSKYSLLFEYTSPKHKIVVSYATENLTLISMVERNTFVIVSDQQLREYAGEYNIPVVGKVDHTLDQILSKRSTTQDEPIEGWVVRYKNGLMVKIKTDWYINQHGDFAGINSMRSNVIIKHVIQQTLDDVIPLLTEAEKIDKINEIADKVRHKYMQMRRHLEHEHQRFLNELEGDKRKYVASTEKSPITHLLLTSIGSGQYTHARVEENLEQNLKKYILKITRTLEGANAFLE